MRFTNKFKATSLIAIALILGACSQGTNKNSYSILFQSEERILRINDERDLEGQGLANSIILLLDNIKNNYSENQLKLVQLYYRSHIQDFIIWGDNGYSKINYFHSSGDFSVSPIRIFENIIDSQKYIFIFSKYNVFSDYDESYRSSVTVFKDNNNIIEWIDAFDEFCNTNITLYEYCEPYNDLWSGRVSNKLNYQSVDSFIVNELILANSFITNSTPYYSSVRLLSRYFQSFPPYYLGVEYEIENKRIVFARKRERICSPSISNCQEIITLSFSNYMFDFQKNEVYNYTNENTTIHKIEKYFSEDFIQEAYDNLLSIVTADEFQNSLIDLKSKNNFSQAELFAFLTYQLREYL
jgi:hypothetical protein